MSVTERFLRYVRIDTEGNPASSEVPSSKTQFHLANLLVKELHAMGIKNAYCDEHCYVYASIPANTPEKIPAIGFIAHLDVESVCKGTGVKPILHKNYAGGDIVLNGGTVLSPAIFPEMNELIGDDLISSDGTTLLGADDKAGVAIIMQAVQYLMQHPDIKHGYVGIAFTPDEELGRGTDYFDVKEFGCDFAYTVDGGKLGEVSYETFNGASATFRFSGVSVHPGDAKNKMINALCVMNEFISLFPESERPSTTSHREGFYHFSDAVASIESATLEAIIRDHDREKFEQRKKFCLSCVDLVNQKYGKEVVSATIEDSYYNCGEIIQQHFHLIENAHRAMESLGVTPTDVPVRGGTDGCRLSFMGLPCPNLCTGGYNCHGVHEFCSVRSMEKTVEIVVKIIQIYAENQ